MNPLDPYKYLLGAIALGSLAAVAAIGIHKYNTFEQDVGAARVQAAWTAQKLIDTQASVVREHVYAKEKEDAALQAAKSVQAAIAANAAVVQSGRVFDGTIKALIARSGTDSVDANRRYTAALGELLGACRSEYQAVGLEAQGHSIDSLMYQNSWPTLAPAQ